MSRRKPRSFIYPTALIDKSSVKLRRQLRRHFLDLWTKKIDRETCRQKGVEAINQNYSEQIESVREYALKRGLNFPDDAEELQSLLEAQETCKQRWNGVVDDAHGKPSLSQAAQKTALRLAKEKLEGG